LTGSAATRFIEDRVPTSRRDEPDARGRRTRDSLSPRALTRYRRLSDP